MGLFEGHKVNLVITLKKKIDQVNLFWGRVVKEGIPVRNQIKNPDIN